MMNRLVPILLIAAAVVFGYAPFLIRDSPAEDTMGVVFKIFYFHVSSALTMMLSAVVCAIASAAYLRRRSRTADHVALAAAELAVVFGAIVLITGPLWARKSWGFWWVWDARVTSTLVMWMMFSSYLLLRKYAGVGSETLSAAVGVFAGVMSPLVYKSVDIWRTQHVAPASRLESNSSRSTVTRRTTTSRSEAGFVNAANSSATRTGQTFLPEIPICCSATSCTGICI